MMFRADGAALAEAAKWVAQALPARPVLPVLAGMLVEIDDDRVRLSTYDGQLGLSVAVPVEVSEPGRMLMGGKLFANVLGNMPRGPVEVELKEGDSQSLVCGKSVSFQLLTMPVEDYPALPQLPELCGELEGDAFRSAVEQVASVTGDLNEVNDLRIDAVRLETRGDLILFVATDRYRIPVAQRRWRRTAPGSDRAVNVPPRALLSFARAAQGTVSLALPENPASGLVGFACNDRSLISGISSGKYPAWENIVSGVNPAVVAQVNVKEFREALQRAELVLDPKKPVWLTFSADCICVEAGSESSMAEMVDAKTQGSDMTCTFNATYLLKALDAVPTPLARLYMNGDQPGMLTAVEGEGDGGYRHVLMPQRCI